MPQGTWPNAAGAPTAGLTTAPPQRSDEALVDEIRAVLADCGGLAVEPARLTADDDLYGAGLTSHGCVGLMLGLEERFDVEFPETLLNRRTFESMAAIRDAVRGLLDGGVA